MKLCAYSVKKSQDLSDKNALIDSADPQLSFLLGILRYSDKCFMI